MFTKYNHAALLTPIGPIATDDDGIFCEHDVFDKMVQECFFDANQRRFFFMD